MSGVALEETEGLKEIMKELTVRKVRSRSKTVEKVQQEEKSYKPFQGQGCGLPVPSTGTIETTNEFLDLTSREWNDSGVKNENSNGNLLLSENRSGRCQIDSKF